MHADDRDGLRAYRFERLPAERVDALVSTRGGGVSRAPYASLNVGLRGDDEADVMANRRRLFGAYALPLERSAWCGQVHGVAVAPVERPGTVVPGTDALVTDLVDVPLCIITADCVPLVLYDPEHHAAGVAHAGWKGTTARIGSATLRVMRARFGTDPARVIAAIGPSIAPDRYEVGEPVIGHARAAYGDAPILRARGDGKALLDLWAANALDLEQAGVARERIEVAGLDTLGEFYSFRAEGETGRFATVVTLRAPTP